jgi:hypothetical protein
MKSVLALATLALVALALEEKTREVAGEAREAYGGIVTQAQKSRDEVAQKVAGHPIGALLLAGGLGCALAFLLPRRR